MNKEEYKKTHKALMKLYLRIKNQRENNPNNQVNVIIILKRK